MLKIAKIVPSVFVLLAAGMMSGQAFSSTTCNKYNTYSASSGSYAVQSNFWNDSVRDGDMCLDYAYETSGKNFTFRNVRNKVSTNGVPLGYPSIYKGCHYGNCTRSSGMPLKVSDLNSASASWSVYTTNVGGKWNAALDLFFDTAQNPGNRYPNGAEIMVWINKRDASSSDRIYPAGTKQSSNATINGSSYEVWKGTVGGTPVISYVRTSKTNSISNLNVKAFIDHAVGAGVVKTTHYLQSIQAGFEPHSGGTGLRSDSFSASVVRR